MSKAVVLEGVGKSFAGGKTVLQGISAEIQPGEFVSIIGPSGCGKSTILNLLAGLDEDHSGFITIDGGRPSRVPSGEIAYVFQDPVLMPWLTIRKNIRLSQELSGQGGETEIDSLLTMTGLIDMSQCYPDQLSGGMRMRASLARAYATRPHVMLMDEPFAALDELTRSRMCADLLEYRRTMKCTTILVTHHLHEAVFLSDRVFVMGPAPGPWSGILTVRLPEPRNSKTQDGTAYRDLTHQLYDMLRGQGP